MAKIKPAEVLDHLGPQVRKALEDAMTATMPETKIDTMEFYKAFKRALGRRCREWELVPNNYVDGD